MYRLKIILTRASVDLRPAVSKRQITVAGRVAPTQWTRKSNARLSESACGGQRQFDGNGAQPLPSAYGPIAVGPSAIRHPLRTGGCRSDNGTPPPPTGDPHLPLLRPAESSSDRRDPGRQFRAGRPGSQRGNPRVTGCGVALTDFSRSNGSRPSITRHRLHGSRSPRCQARVAPRAKMTSV